MESLGPKVRCVGKALTSADCSGCETPARLVLKPYVDGTLLAYFAAPTWEWNTQELSLIEDEEAGYFAVFLRAFQLMPGGPHYRLITHIGDANSFRAWT